jgi:hypothetical protein
MTPPIDTFNIMLSWAGAVIGFLVMLVQLLVLSRFSHVESKVKEIADDLRGKDGSWTRLTKLEEWYKGAEARLLQLERGGLSREVFEREMNGQNKRLEEVQANTRDLDTKLDRLDRAVGNRYPSPQPYPAKR